MMRARVTLLFSILFLFITAAAEGQKRAMTTDDFINMVNPVSAILSPDGESVLFGKSELNWDENKRETTWYIMPADSGAAYQYIGEQGASDLKYSPDGRFISLKREKDDKTQLYLLPTSGGEAIQLTEHASSIGAYEWGHDSKTIYFVASVPREGDEKKEYDAGLDHLFVDEAPHGQTEGAWNNIWMIDIDTKEETRLTHEELRVGQFAVSPDQKRIAYTARFENRRNQQYKSEIYLLEKGDSTAVQLTDNDVPESGLNWLPDNRHIIFTAPHEQDWELKHTRIWKMDLDEKTWTNLTGGFDGNIRSFHLSDDGETIYLNAAHRTNTNLWSFNIGSGKFTQLTDLEGTLQVQDYDRHENRVLYRFENITTPPDFYTARLDDLDNPVRLTQFNPLVTDSLALAEYKLVTWESYDGLEIEGIKYLPEGLQQNSEAPFLLHIHGGPASFFSNRFISQYHVWAGLGFVQLAPNVRGSTSYGDEFLRGNMYDIGDGDYKDLMSGVDMLIEEGWIDSDKKAVRGWSYGGILGGTTITKTDRFKAASLGAGVFDWTSEYALGFNHDVRLWYIGGEPWTNPDGYRKRSAAMHADRVTTPTLFLHGERDRVDTPEQSLIFFTFMKDIGKADTRYILFKREGHGITEPRNQRTRDIEEIRWIKKYTLGEEWEPWERESGNNDESTISGQ